MQATAQRHLQSVAEGPVVSYLRPQTSVYQISQSQSLRVLPSRPRECQPERIPGASERDWLRQKVIPSPASRYTVPEGLIEMRLKHRALRSTVLDVDGGYAVSRQR